MADQAKHSGPAPRWHYPLCIGLAIGISRPVTGAVAEALQLSSQSWSVLLLRLVVAGTVGGLVAFGAGWLLKIKRLPRRSRRDIERNVDARSVPVKNR